MERWKNLDGHANYLISDMGRIKRIDTGKIYNGIVNNKGYLRFDLCENGKRFVIAGHRAVAEAFIPKVDGKEFVNHIDGNKQNNCYQNLEWCTVQENSIHAHKVLGVKPVNMRPVVCVETGVKYESICDAERKTGISNVLIQRCCSGSRKTTHKLHWEYADLV